MKKTVVELFAGVGGFRVGLNDIHSIDKNGRAIENRDWEFVWANQWEPSTKTQHAYECYKLRFGADDSISNEDISSVDKSTLPNHSLLVGGFPCQDYSVARTLSGEKGIQGKKGVLFWDIADILQEKKPPFVLLENVDRLLRSPASQRGRDFGIMLRTFYDQGYNVEWRVINAADYGAAQRRRRTFIFAWRRDTKYNQTIVDAKTIVGTAGAFATCFPIEQEFDFRETDLTQFNDTVEMTDGFKFDFANTGVMIDGIVYTTPTTPIKETPVTLRQIRETGKDLSEYFLTGEREEKFKYLKGSKRIPRVRPNGEQYFYSEGAMSFPDDLDLPGRTMLTSESSVNRSTHVIEDEQTKANRLITPIEAERLQAFPDNWTNSGMPESRRYFMMGNALVTLIPNKLEPFLSQLIENEL
ncbi:DNA (cytosine-5-)-methyltransferase [uncultured Dubosiella sp.]|uniref:DNA (cytosine-5-)-methyltransferase n=1 Tax=uncultured Dubosiella sp. TaxID=1937011 RepID=UPI0025A5B720|nr:DNA (cytosine-5-)-methyltransferase [uncultured Dubosiella sp.]